MDYLKALPLSDLADVSIASGAHRTREEGVCSMEAVAWLAGLPHSDAPVCTAAPLQKFVTRTNDWMTAEERKLLIPFLPRLITTSSGGREVDQQAAFIFADWSVREVAPVAMEARGRPELATRLRAIAPITDKASAIAARDETREVRNAAYDAAASAAASAADAAASAAYAAASAASAYVSAASAASAAAASAASAAAYAADAAYDAAAADVGRKQSVDRRLEVLDRVLKNAYGK